MSKGNVMDFKGFQIDLDWLEDTILIAIRLPSAEQAGAAFVKLQEELDAGGALIIIKRGEQEL